MILFDDFSPYLKDKTFGLKNKKGKKQQEFVKAVQNQMRQPTSNEEKKVYSPFNESPPHYYLYYSSVRQLLDYYITPTTRLLPL
jgi:hypothetical protein